MSKFDFNDITKCATCLQAKSHKNSPGIKNLRDTVSHPYQAIYVDYAFAGKVSCDDEGNIIESTRKDVEGINGEKSWILISDAQTRMLHGDARLSKSSPLTYLESFLKEYSPNVKDKWVILDQGGELFGNPKVHNLFNRLGYNVLCTGGYAS